MAFHKNVKYWDLGGVQESQLTTKLITTMEDGSVYKGQWLGNKRWGYGVAVWPDGSKYEGTWENDQ